MATWRGTPRKFDLERYEPGAWGGHYESVEFTWEYGTVADILTVIETDSSGPKQTLYGKGDAEALLYTLAQWYGRYEGVSNLKKLLNDILGEPA